MVYLCLLQKENLSLFSFRGDSPIWELWSHIMGKHDDFNNYPWLFKLDYQKTQLR